MKLASLPARTVWILALSASSACASEALLPNSERWTPPADIVSEQYREMKAYYDRRLQDAAAERRRTPVQPAENRAALARMLGMQDRFTPPKAEMTPAGPGVWLVSWPVLRLGTVGATMGGAFPVREYGLLMKPAGPGPYPVILALPDADETAAGAARKWARPGAVVFAPFFVQREAFCEPWLDDRAWLFRLAYLTGRHLAGSEVQQVSAAIDFLASVPEADTRRITVAGSGQGGWIARLAAALDGRIGSVQVPAHSGPPAEIYDEPEDRMLWGYGLRFDDTALESLIAPRKLVTADPPAAADGPSVHLDGAALARIRNHQFTEWQAWYRNRALEAYRVREANWKPDTTSIEAYRRSVQPQMDAYFDGIGRYPAPAGPLDARSLPVYDTPEFSGHHLQVRVYDGVNAYGILLTPKSIRPGQRLPVVFVQHGYANRPEDAIGLDSTPRMQELYGRFGMRLAQRGYVVFAPMIGVQDGVKRTQLVRQSHLLGLTPVGLELKKFGRVLDYLAALPFADAERVGFYGLSYGGYTALRIGPGEPRFKVVIASGDFNETTVKNSDLTQGTSFLFYRVTLDRYKFGWLNYLSDSILASLIAPRAYMTEIGSQDPVIVEPRRLPEMEIDRYMDIYRRLRIPERGRVARFDGPHRIDGEEAFAFLDKFLKP